MTTTSQASFDNQRVLDIARSIDDVRARIADAGRDPATVRIVGVTKTFDVATVRAAVAAGITAVGENYLTELEEKRAVTDVPVRWHYLGALQTNKIARIAAVADVVSGVSRAKELTKLAQCGPGGVIDVQVDTTGRAERNGAPPTEVGDLVRMARDLGLNVRGLMVVAPPDPDGARDAFETVGRLADDLEVRERSMGMTEDYQLAVTCGSTEVRLGRLLFGFREGRGAALT